MDYSGLSHNELITKLQDLTKRIIYIERTQMGASTLPQLRQIFELVYFMSKYKGDKRLDLVITEFDDKYNSGKLEEEQD